MTLQWHRQQVDQEIRRVAEGPEVTDRLMEYGDAIAEEARRLAPKGVGAESIHAEVVEGGHGREVHVSWDVAHFWMGFGELGTVHERPRPFLRPAARRYS